jgi:hypothetical protein
MGRVGKVWDNVGTGCKGSGQRWDGLERFGTTLGWVGKVRDGLETSRFLCSKPVFFCAEIFKTRYSPEKKWTAYQKLISFFWLYAAFNLRQLKVKEIACDKIQKSTVFLTFSAFSKVSSCKSHMN